MAPILVSVTEFVQRVTKTLNSDVQDLAVKVANDISNALEVVFRHDTAYVDAVVTVGSTQIEAKVGASPLAKRKELRIFNDGNKTIFYGPTGVTSSGDNKGVSLQSGESVIFDVGENISIFMISTTSGSHAIVEEFS